jgi:hypothetical protein
VFRSSVVQGRCCSGRLARWYPSYSIPVFKQAGISSGVARLVPEQWLSPIQHGITKDIRARPPKFTNTHHGSEESKRYLRRNRQFTVPRIGYLWTQHWFGRPFQSSACVCRKIAIFSWWVWSREIPNINTEFSTFLFFQTLFSSQMNDERTPSPPPPRTNFNPSHHILQSFNMNSLSKLLLLGILLSVGLLRGMIPTVVALTRQSPRWHRQSW